jgi:NodT family efflux transporter outer membrane factor (OMF) lipoprotein
MRLGRTLVPAIAVLAAPLAACGVVGPDYARPSAIVSAQYKEIKGWKIASPRDDLAKGDWWQLFRDPTLDRLESQVAVSNQTIKADEANYREALALIAEARAALFPMVNFDPSLTQMKSSTGVVTQLDAEVSGSWTLDVWGKTRRAVEQETAAAEASAADLANATLAEQAALALAYVQLRQADSLADLLNSTVAEYKRSVEIAQNQYNVGAAAKSDLITAQALELSAEAQAVNVGVARSQSEHAIAVLTGRPPAELAISHGKLALDVPRIPIGIPSELLERRPDIAAAERTMQEENAAIGVAFAGYYPDFTLTGAFGYSGDPFIKQIAGANPVWSYGLSIAQTLFNGGLTRAQVEAARQTYNASVATYRQTVLTAFQQVEDELAAIPLESRQMAIQTEAVKAAEQAVEIALNEYRAGTQNFTTVVTAEATALSDEESALSTRAARLTATVNLVVALGGGWSTGDLPIAQAD